MRICYPVFDVNRVTFVPNCHNASEHHLFVGMNRGVVLPLPTGIVGKGVFIEKDDVAIDICKFKISSTYHYSDTQAVYEAFRIAFDQVMGLCQEEAGIPGVIPVEDFLVKGCVPRDVLWSRDVYKYTCVVKTIRITGFRVLGNEWEPMIEAHEIRIII